MASWHAITHAHLIDGNGGPTMVDATVLIRDREIHAVGKGIELPPEAEIIDAAGRTVMPGLVEGHAHVGGNPLQDLRLLYDETKIALVMKEGAVEHVTSLYRDHYRIGIEQTANRYRVTG